jgi:hypothetical protein
MDQDSTQAMIVFSVHNFVGISHKDKSSQVLDSSVPLDMVSNKKHEPVNLSLDKDDA